MSLRAPALVLGGLFVAASGMIWPVAGSSTALAVLAGGSLPIAISVVSLYILLAGGTRGGQQGYYQRFVVMNFLVKVVLIGMWLAFILLATPLPRIPFVISLLANFFAWHVYEGYCYQSYLRGPRTAKV